MAESVSETEELVKKTGATSIIWTWFGFKPSDEQQKNILCRVCGAKVPAKSGNTTNLFYHLKTKHVVEYHQHCQAMQPTARSSTKNAGQKKQELIQTSIQQSFSKGTPYIRKSPRWIEITRAITVYLCKDMVPFQTVERRGFKAMIRAIDPRYEVPSRKYFTETEMPKLYAELRENVEKELCDLKYFATTTDLWSSRTMEPFLSLTIHYITDDWNLGSRCLQTSYFPAEHSAEEIAQGLKEALESWGFKEESQVCITTDNGTNVVKAASLNDWTRLQCFGHRLHLAIEKSMKDPRTDRAVGVCKKIVSAFSYSWKRRKELKKAQAEHHLPFHRLITDTPTRWGSRQMMIQRVLEQEKALSQVLKADKKTKHLVPTWQDTDVLESISRTLGPLLEFTDALSGEDYVSVSYIKPVLHIFNNTVLAAADDDTELTKDMKRVILECLNEKYSDPKMVDLLDMASLVDPRFKDAYIADDRQEFIKTRAVAEILSLLEVQAATVREPLPHTSTEAAADGAEAAEVAVERQSKKVKRSLGSFFKKASSDGTAALTDREAIKVELKSYLQTMQVDAETDPLDWWRLYQANFPRVARLAQKYLCIPATSAPSERAFSFGGNIVTCHRSLLKPETVDKLVFLANNL
ncbi:E3 SUMO-protein ligase ZBED1-like [Tachysurus fulvidraco]|uniref:E3 SUMO-protein ligase ZBED1-like n=1 Tax=Tachysurus fulvidraco TaxID=1234273 RepID=UPI001FEF5381|nr:E3 SUMO-protein ligase ZBED1-like [Tachysurus fulvidraco]